mmetsp:Transcript_98214/g.194544  ORF Transcript_98214/g.194544 Transcript_98214/m.194544 type:complete len:210 (+) Transcript_98214:674-1303(+)
MSSSFFAAVPVPPVPLFERVQVVIPILVASSARVTTSAAWCQASSTANSSFRAAALCSASPQLGQRGSDASSRFVQSMQVLAWQTGQTWLVAEEGSWQKWHEDRRRCSWSVQWLRISSPTETLAAALPGPSSNSACCTLRAKRATRWAMATSAASWRQCGHSALVRDSRQDRHTVWWQCGQRYPRFPDELQQTTQFTCLSSCGSSVGGS